MSRLSPLPREALADFEPIFQIVKRRMGFLPTGLLILGRRPEMLYGFFMLSGSVFGIGGELPRWLMLKLALKNMWWAIRRRAGGPSSVPHSLKFLIAFVASSAAGCRYCEAHTGIEIVQAGVSVEKLKAVWEFESSPLFSDAEKAALRVAAAGAVVPNAVTDQLFEDLRRHFNEFQIVEILAVISLFGFLNRWHDSLATTLEAVPFKFAQGNLVEGGWEPGIHRPSD